MPVKYIQLRLSSSAFSTLDRLSIELEQACQDNFVNVSNEWLESREKSRDDVIVDLLANDTLEPTDIFGIPFYEEAKLTLKLKIQRLNTLDRRIVLIFDTETMGLSAYDTNRFRKVEEEYAIIKYSDKNINSQFQVSKYEQDLIFRPERLQLTTECGIYKSFPAHADLCLSGDRTDIETTFSCQDGCFMTGLSVDDLYNPRPVDLDTRRNMMLLKRTPQKEPQRRGSNWGNVNENNVTYRQGRRRYGSGQCRPNSLFSGYRDPDDDEDYHRRREAERSNGAVSRINQGLRPVSRQGADAVTPSQLRREGESKKATGSQRPEIPKLPTLLSGVEYKVGAALRDEDSESGHWGWVKNDQKDEGNDLNEDPDPGEANFAVPNAVVNQVILHGNWTDDQMELLSFTRNEAKRILKPPEIKNWINSIKRNTYMTEDTKSIYSDIIEQDDEVSVAKVMDVIIETFTDKCSVASTDKESLLDYWDDFDSDVKQKSSSQNIDTKKIVLTDSMRGTTVVRGGVMAQGAWAQGPPRPPNPGSQWAPRHQGPPPYRGRGAGSSRGSVTSPRPGYRPYDGQGGRGYQGHAGGQDDRNYEPSRGRGSSRGTPRGPPSVSPSRSWSDRETSQGPGTRSPAGSMGPPIDTLPLKVERINTEDYEDEEIRNEKWIKSRIPCRFLDERRGGYVLPTHETFTSAELNKFYRKKLKRENRRAAALVYHRVFLLSKCYQLMLTLYVRKNPFANNELEDAIETQEHGVRIAFNVVEREIKSEAHFVSFVMAQGESLLILLKHLCTIVRKQVHLMNEQDVFDLNWARGSVVCHQIRTHEGFLQIYQDQIEIDRYKIKLVNKALQSYPNSACSLMPPGPIPAELSNDLHDLQQKEGLIQDEQPKEGRKGKKVKVKNSPALGGEGKKNFSASALVNKFLNHEYGAEEKVEEIENELKEFEEKLKPQGYKAKIDTYFFLVDSAKNENSEGKFEKLKRQRFTIVAESLMMTVCCINADAMKYKDTRLMERSGIVEGSHGDNEQARTSPESEERGEKAESLTEVAEPMEVTEPTDPSQSLVTIESPNDMVTEVTGTATDVVMGNGVSPNMVNSQLDGAIGSPEVAIKILNNEKGKTKE